MQIYIHTWYIYLYKNTNYFIIVDIISLNNNINLLTVKVTIFQLIFTNIKIVIVFIAYVLVSLNNFLSLLVWMNIDILMNRASNRMNVCES